MDWTRPNMLKTIYGKVYNCYDTLSVKASELASMWKYKDDNNLDIPDMIGGMFYDPDSIRTSFRMSDKRRNLAMDNDDVDNLFPAKLKQVKGNNGNVYRARDKLPDDHKNVKKPMKLNHPMELKRHKQNNDMDVEDNDKRIPIQINRKKDMIGMEEENHGKVRISNEEPDKKNKRMPIPNEYETPLAPQMPPQNKNGPSFKFPGVMGAQQDGGYVDPNSTNFSRQTDPGIGWAGSYLFERGKDAYAAATTGKPLTKGNSDKYDKNFENAMLTTAATIGTMGVADEYMAAGKAAQYGNKIKNSTSIIEDFREKPPKPWFDTDGVEQRWEKWGFGKGDEAEEPLVGGRMLSEKSSYKPNASNGKPSGVPKSSIDQKTYTGLSLPKISNTPTYDDYEAPIQTQTATSTYSSYLDKLRTLVPSSTSNYPSYIPPTEPIPTKNTPTTYKPSGGKGTPQTTSYNNPGYAWDPVSSLKSGFDILF